MSSRVGSRAASTSSADLEEGGSSSDAPPPSVRWAVDGRERSFLANRHQHISSADHVITVSPSRRTSRAGSSSSLPFYPPALAAAAAAAAASAAAAAAAAGDSDDGGTSTPATASPRRQSSFNNGTSAAARPPPSPPRPPAAAAAGAAAAPKAAPDELLEPLLVAADQPDGADPETEGFDPYPATTAARAAAAKVARYRELQRGAGQARAALVAQADAGAAATAAAVFQRQLRFAYLLSWVVNIVLMGAKLYAYWLSSSKAVLASAADSAVDLVSQMVIAYADWRIRTEDPRFPVGQARLEAIGVLACACIMSVASFEVIQESVSVLWHSLATGELPQLELGLIMYLVLGSATGLKLLCWGVCAALQGKSDSMLALAEDHLNDVLSNTCAIIAAVAAGLAPNGWWVDPGGAIAISLWIVARWLDIAKQQVDKIVGRGAPADFVQQLEALVANHHIDMGLDVLRAYFFGSRYIVELEVVLPADMTVRESHDISLDLQHKIEQMEEVERAFVHVDYLRRDGLEHKVERELAIARAISTTSSGRLVDAGAPAAFG